MTQPESRLSSNILGAVRQRPRVFAWKVWGGDVQMAGLPDIAGIVEGKFFGIESKMPGKRDNLSPKQELVHESIRRALGAVKVCCSIKEAVEFVEAVRRGEA